MLNFIITFLLYNIRCIQIAYLPSPLDETHFVAMRGLIHPEVSTKVHQRGELN